MRILSVRTKLFLGIGASLVLVLLIGISNFYSLKELEKDQEWVDHTEQVIAKTNLVYRYIVEAEGLQRGYLLRSDSDFLNQYLDVSKSSINRTNYLINLTKDNPEQSLRAIELKKIITDKVMVMNNLIAIKNRNYSGNLSESELVIRSKELMYQINNKFKQIIREENALLIIRRENSSNAINKITFIIILGTILIFVIVIFLFKNILKAFSRQREARREIKQINASLEKSLLENEEKNWILLGSVIVDEAMRGLQDVKERAGKVTSEVSKFIKAEMAVMYVIHDDSHKVLKPEGAYSFSGDKSKIFHIGEGAIGQAAKDGERLIISDIPEDYIKITTGLGNTKPKSILIQPFFFQDELIGVIEFAFVHEISPKVLSFLDKAITNIGIGMQAASARVKMQQLFDQIQKQTEELQSQQEELRVSNEELLSKTEMLQSSEEELKVQQEELRETNYLLEEKAKLLNEKNEMVFAAKEAITLKMKELEQTNKYKSEFLANMSHELRTPLNSILILARILKDNKEENLSADEVKYANVIFKAGSDLLELINDILDLSKIESGYVELNPEHIKLQEVKNDLRLLFDELAASKELNFEVEIDNNLPEQIFVDKQRLAQIIKNLLSNAFKFTSKDGLVKVNFLKKDNLVEIVVKDTGIGIPKEKQKLIFEAFQQADGSTSREYGGTGLGLSISKELAKLMGATISLVSKPGEGSSFILSLPLEQKVKVEEEKQYQINQLADFTEIISTSTIKNSVDTPVVKRDKPLLLIVEDDKIFSSIIKEFGTSRGFDVLQIFNGNDVLETVETKLPNAILMDVMLPGIDGWELLKQIKLNQKIADIPVYMMSASDHNKENDNKGALSYIRKPIDKDKLDEIFDDFKKLSKGINSKVLLIEDHVVQSDVLTELFKQNNIAVEQAFTGKEALEKLNNDSFDCIILDLNLPDISGLDILESIKENERLKDIPVIINTAMELDQEKMQKLLKYSNATVLKSVKSGDRLIDEVNLFLHKVQATEKYPKSSDQRKVSGDLKDKAVLLVDDDMRNIFALSTILDQQGCKVEIANDGLEALKKLEVLDGLDIILMDIMMPQMDGYETMQRIREMKKWQNLPIIALTAKAMKEDKEKCLNAGANDYITKPIDVDQLISLMKVWTSK